MRITEYSMEKVEDVTGILTGDRYEFILYVEVPEDDELYSENGVYIKVIFATDKTSSRMIQYQIFEKITDKYIDLELEEDEETMLYDFCSNHLD